MKPVTVHQTLSPADAELVCSRLLAAGFNAAVTHELSAFSTGYSLTTGGVRVEVPQEESEDAKALLAEEAKPATAE